MFVCNKRNTRCIAIIDGVSRVKVLGEPFGCRKLTISSTNQAFSRHGAGGLRRLGTHHGFRAEGARISGAQRIGRECAQA